jgi:aryl-alcohol dehydrogenase-like predicted oxidoreductase
MRYRLLGGSGLRVSELCLGTMTFGNDWGWGADPRECRAMFDAFVDRGGNFVDTANNYTGGTAERLVGEFATGRRDALVLASKYSLHVHGDDVNGGGNHRKSLARAIDGTLRRLGTDYLDLYWVHVWDALTPIEETLRALDDAVRAGKVLYVGLSDAPAWVASRADAIARARGLSAPVAVQTRYSLVDRAAERDTLPMADALDLAVLAWAPLGAGALSGKYNDPEDRPSDTRFARWAAKDSLLTERNLAIAAEAARIARELGRTPAQVALAWLRDRARVLIPIVGARTRAQLEENLGCLDVALAADHRERLDAASELELGFPHDFYAQPAIRELVYGARAHRVIDHRGAIGSERPR